MLPEADMVVDKVTSEPPPALSPREVLDGLASSWREPGTRLGFWTHMGTQFSGTVFALLWGVPYLVAGQGMSTGAASAMLTLLVAAGLVAGPLFGEFTARHPLRRSWLVLTVIGTTAVAWTIVLAVPPPAPRWLLAVLVVVLALAVVPPKASDRTPLNPSAKSERMSTLPLGSSRNGVVYRRDRETETPVSLKMPNP